MKTEVIKKGNDDNIVKEHKLIQTFLGAILMPIDDGKAICLHVPLGSGWSLGEIHSVGGIEKEDYLPSGSKVILTQE